MLNKNQKLINELEKEKALTLRYKGIITKMLDKLRAQKETNSNPYTLIRDLNKILQDVNFDKER